LKPEWVAILVTVVGSIIAVLWRTARIYERIENILSRLTTLEKDVARHDKILSYETGVINGVDYKKGAK
jgi:hypothetical protein